MTNALSHLWAADPDQEGLPRCSPLPTATATGWIPNHQHHPVPNSPNTVCYAGACTGWPIKLSCRSGVSPTLFGKLVPGGLYGDLSGGLWGFCLYLSVQENIGCRVTTELAERQYRPSLSGAASHEGLTADRLLLTPTPQKQAAFPRLRCSFQSLTAEARATQPSPHPALLHHMLPTDRA